MHGTGERNKVPPPPPGRKPCAHGHNWFKFRFSETNIKKKSQKVRKANTFQIVRYFRKFTSGEGAQCPSPWPPIWFTDGRHCCQKNFWNAHSFLCLFDRRVWNDGSIVVHQKERITFLHPLGQRKHQSVFSCLPLYTTKMLFAYVSVSIFAALIHVLLHLWRKLCVKLHQNHRRMMKACHYCKNKWKTRLLHIMKTMRWGWEQCFTIACNTNGLQI